MSLALQLAKTAMQKGEVPIGSLVIQRGEVISTAVNSMNADNDSTAHAELLAIKEAHIKLSSRFLVDCDLYTTLEPCTMCSGAISLARIKTVYFGAYDIKTGAIYNGARVFNNSSCHHKPEVYGGIMEKECSDLLSNFFQKIKQNKRI